MKGYEEREREKKERKKRDRQTERNKQTVAIGNN